MKKTYRHAIDLNAPGGLDQLFAANRALFGDATMLEPGDPNPNPNPNPTPTPNPDPKPTNDGDKLGEPGLKALQQERDARAAAEKELATLREKEAQRERAEMTELQKAQDDAARAAARTTQLELENTRLKAIADHSVPAKYQKFVTGTNAAEFATSAAEVAELAAKAEATPSKTNEVIPGSGNRDPQGSGGGGTGGSISAGADRYRQKNPKK